MKTEKKVAPEPYPSDHMTEKEKCRMWAKSYERAMQLPDWAKYWTDAEQYVEQYVLSEVGRAAQAAQAKAASEGGKARRKYTPEDVAQWQAEDLKFPASLSKAARALKIAINLKLPQEAVDTIKRHIRPAEK